MGASSSKAKATAVTLKAAVVDIDIDSLGAFSFGVAEPYEVQHYLPPQFPIIPVLTPTNVDICRRTWDLIQTAGTDKMRQYGKPGIILFYDEFFYRIFERDTTIREVFPKVQQRAEVLIKAINFILSTRAGTPASVMETVNACRFLGHKHRAFAKVRPHHFAVYTNTCIEVIMYWLGEFGSHEVGTAWSHTVGFILRHILEAFLFQRTDPYESYQITTIAAVREITESSLGSAASRADTFNVRTDTLKGPRRDPNAAELEDHGRGYGVPGDLRAAHGALVSADQLYQVQLAHQQQLQAQLQQVSANVAQQLAAASSTNFPFPRNSPDFACENVGDRIKGKRRKYCPHEVTALVLGVQRYADDSCPWSSILRDPHLGPLFHGRSGVDLKDKWRTLIKTRTDLASYTENRKNHRKYRPFTALEERALIDGVKKYSGQRNVWSLILVDKDLGVQFNDRSNVQLKDKYRTLRRSGLVNSVSVATPSSRKPARPGKPGLMRGPLSPKSRQTLNAAAAQLASSSLLQQQQSMFTDPNLFMSAQLSLGQLGQLTIAQAQAQVQAQLQAQVQAVQVQSQSQAAQAAQAKTFSQMLAAANSSYNNALPAFMISGSASPQNNLFYNVGSPAADDKAKRAPGKGVRSGKPAKAATSGTKPTVKKSVIDKIDAPLSPRLLESMIPMPASVQNAPARQSEL
ncbi:hypothetical protein ACHHYP_12918 [Achlya hypogyna]|uniref:Myb-like domain-containing protein n=1 Tax=Achlya hypogyna TaxID=1202772 RepID=A0A1V9ZGT6_ACHHY|nr:hypothetical protein ACHHYP_12918 [Achlya hypogyna]